MEQRERGSHGDLGRDRAKFTNMLPLREVRQDIEALAILGRAMSFLSGDPVDDGPDPEENMFVPAGYTYFGQFIDHDLTFDPVSTLLEPKVDPNDKTLSPAGGPKQSTSEPFNGRTPKFDLDCVYGAGPADQPYMYDDDGATLLWGAQNNPQAGWDLLRTTKGRAIIGDKRNDENSIVSQIQMLFVHFHNKVVEEIKVTSAKAGAPLSGGALFAAARDQVRWAYQRIVVEDFLPRIVDKDVLKKFVDAWNDEPNREAAFKLYKQPIRTNLPREFVAAAYRFGHSGVRTGYRLNGKPGPKNGTSLEIFDGTAGTQTSLIGFDALPTEHVIDDWGRFFPLNSPAPGKRKPENDGKLFAKKDGGDGSVRLQYAYKQDTTLVDPLASLPSAIASPSDVPDQAKPEFVNMRPSLATLNLLRGRAYDIASGQEVADRLNETPLDPKYLVVRVDSDDGFFYRAVEDISFNGKAIGNALADTPLWFYVLAEAQKPLVDYWISKDLEPSKRFLSDDDLRTDLGCHTQLGPVGGRIVTEVFYGLLAEDDDSFVNRAPKDFYPVWGRNLPVTVAGLIQYVAKIPITQG